MLKKKYQITNPKGIDEKIFVPLNGQEQYIFLRGEDAENPVVLYLHGGPGGPDSFLTYEFARQIGDEYTLVCWDQRGCGRTYFRNRKADPDNLQLSFEQALTDLDELVDYLCRRFTKDKIILLAHSYGSLLGANYVKRHPERIEKYIGIGQHISMTETEAENFEKTIALMKQEGKSTDKLEAVYESFQKEPTVLNLLEVQKIVRPYLAAHLPKVEMKNQIKLALSSPDFGLTDLRWALGMFRISKHYKLCKQLLDETLLMDLRDAGGDFSVPVYFISGEYDIACSVNLVKEYYENISAPFKTMVTIENCVHSPHIDSPMAFAEVFKKLPADEEM